MPKIFNTSDSPQELAQRMGGKAELRLLLEGLEPGQAVVYGPEEPAHTHRNPADNVTNRYVCQVQEMVARINRKPRTGRLKSMHNPEGDILITCYERGVYRGN
jgi:hypothetical protein